mmetsp:Transcript_3592/g.13976  ORF Transcript_3592/g.13976 Transcript_3592/m.13976 type:complete len:201 (+) Transcript_3592:2140-2742(+)
MRREGRASTSWRRALGTSPRGMRPAVLASQRALAAVDGGSSVARGQPDNDDNSKLPPIFLWQLHTDGYLGTPELFDAVLRELGAPRDEDVLLHVGLCNATEVQVRRAAAVLNAADSLEPRRLACVQNNYSLWNLEAEQPLPDGAAASSKKGVLPACRELGLAFMPHGPLGGLAARRCERDLAALFPVARRRGAAPQGVSR